LPLPGGLADAEGKSAYVAGINGTIDGVDLATGKLIWESKLGSKPLALDGKRLAVQAAEPARPNALRIVVLDLSAEGQLLGKSDPVVFPDWVVLGVAHGRSFTSTGRIDQGNLYLTWEARAWYAGGARPTPEIERAARKEARGVAKVNLDSGKVEMLKPEEAP